LIANSQHWKKRIGDIEMEADDGDLPASYLLYIAAALVVIGIAAVSIFFILIR
jgi:hypothetical protein